MKLDNIIIMFIFVEKLGDYNATISAIYLSFESFIYRRTIKLSAMIVKKWNGEFLIIKKNDNYEIE